jgi:hypothetical protein
MLHGLQLRPAERRGVIPGWRVALPVFLLWLTVLHVTARPAVQRWLEVRLPYVDPVNVYESFVDTTLVPITITAGTVRVPLTVTRERLLTDPTLWRRMHVADWNAVASPEREQGLAAMMRQYRHLRFAPERWDRMEATDWDLVPQPIRVLAYRHMVEYWSGFYDVGRAHGLPRRLVSDTLTAIVMSESWFDHRAVNVGYQGQRDFGLAQASEYARKRMDAWFHAGLVDVSMSDEDYFNPWMGTRFVAIWMARLIEETNGDLDFAVRAYHRGTHRAFDDRGDVYLAYVRRRRDRFIRNLGAPQAWNYLWQQDRKDRVAAWPWIVRPRNVDRRS